jgi:hypothetical protein
MIYMRKLKAATNITLGVIALAVAYTHFRKAAGIDKDVLFSVLLLLMPWALIGFVVHHTRNLAPIVVAWCAVLIGQFTVRVEWGCRAGPDCGWMMIICVVASWLGAIVAAMFTSRKRL